MALRICDTMNVKNRAWLFAAGLSAMLMFSVGCGGEATLEDRLVGEWFYDVPDDEPGSGRISMTFHADGSAVTSDGDSFTWEVDDSVEPPELISDIGPVAQLLEVTEDRMRIFYGDLGAEQVWNRASDE